METKESAKVGIIMGSISDWDTMKEAAIILDELEVPYEKSIVSAHRTPKKMFEYAQTAADRGISVIIAGAGGAVASFRQHYRKALLGVRRMAH